MSENNNGYLFFGISDYDNCGDYFNIIKKLKLPITNPKDDYDYGIFLINKSLPKGLKCGYHNRYDRPMPMIYILKTYLDTYETYPKRFKELPNVNLKLIKMLEVYAQKLGWKNPSWMIASCID